MHTRTIKVVTLTVVFAVLMFSVPASFAHASFWNFHSGPNGSSISGCTQIGHSGVYIGGHSSSGGGSTFSLGSNSSSCSGISGPAGLIIGIINNVLVPLIFAIAFIVFLWGMFRYFIAGGDNPEEQKKGRELLMYGIIGFVIMISLWGIVNVVANTFNFGGQVHPPLPYL